MRVVSSLNHENRIAMTDQRSKRFGLLCYPGTDNLGDEIQSLAAKRFLPWVSSYFNREYLSMERRRPGELYWTIMNAWYCHHPANWPPSPAILPLLTSLHITQERSESNLVASEVFLTEPAINYLHASGPVGARDLATLRLLRNAGVESYFSGCLTLTLRRPRVERDANLLVLTDVSDDAEKIVRRRTRKRIVKATHATCGLHDSYRRFARAEELLQLYARASCVVTSRLHCAMPCLALHTPVLFLAKTHDQYRYSGLIDLTHSCDPDQFTEDPKCFDFDDPPDNDSGYLHLQQGLERTARAFISGNERRRE